MLVASINSGPNCMALVPLLEYYELKPTSGSRPGCQLSESLYATVKEGNVEKAKLLLLPLTLLPETLQTMFGQTESPEIQVSHSPSEMTGQYSIRTQMLSWNVKKVMVSFSPWQFRFPVKISNPVGYCQHTFHGSAAPMWTLVLKRH